jgi:hypothetical protein
VFVKLLAWEFPDFAERQKNIVSNKIV